MNRGHRVCKAPLDPKASRAHRESKGLLGQMANPDLKAPRVILGPKGRKVPKVRPGMQARRDPVDLRA